MIESVLSGNRLLNIRPLYLLYQISWHESFQKRSLLSEYTFIFPEPKQKMCGWSFNLMKRVHRPDFNKLSPLSQDTGAWRVEVRTTRLKSPPFYAIHWGVKLRSIPPPLLLCELLSVQIWVYRFHKKYLIQKLAILEKS